MVYACSIVYQRSGLGIKSYATYARGIIACSTEAEFDTSNGPVECFLGTTILHESDGLEVVLLRSCYTRNKYCEICTSELVSTEYDVRRLCHLHVVPKRLVQRFSKRCVEPNMVG